MKNKPLAQHYISPVGKQSKPITNPLVASIGRIKNAVVKGVKTFGRNMLDNMDPNYIGTQRQPEHSREFLDKMNNSVNRMKGIQSYKKGGKVKKTGLALVHKGELVLTKKQQNKQQKKLKGSSKSKLGGKKLKKSKKK